MDSKSTNLACTFETMKRIQTTAIVELLEAVREAVVDDDRATDYCGYLGSFQNRIFASDEMTIRLLVYT